MPFILRGVSLLGIDSVNAKSLVRRKVWERLGSDMKPAHLSDIVQTVEFDELPSVFPKLMQSAMRGRVVVKVA